MINISDVVARLITRIPLHTDIFSEGIGVDIDSSEVLADGRTVEVTTDTAHSLSVDEKIIVKNAEVKNDIVDVVEKTEGIEITLNNKHDYRAGTERKITIADTGTDYDGESEILQVVSDCKLTIPKKAGVITPVEGAIWEDRPYSGNGVMVITEVPGENIFRYEIQTESPSLPVNPLRNIEIIRGLRIAGAADPDRAIQAYSKRGAGRSWLFVLFPADDVSHDRHSMTDAIATFGDGAEGRLRIVANFDVVGILPVSSFCGVDEVEKANGELKTAVIKALYGIKSPQGTLSDNFKMIYTGSSTLTYDSTVYIRNYSFQVPHDVTFRNVDIADPLTVALRRAIMQLSISGNEEIEQFRADTEVL